MVSEALIRRHNGGVDAAARIHERIAGPIMMRNTPLPLASNDLFGVALIGSRKIEPEPSRVQSRVMVLEICL
jgi:hypothetical protein